MNDENISLNSNLPSGFDDKPIGNKMKFDIPEYAQNEAPSMIPEVSVPQKLPLIKRLQSNALKNKKQALEELLLLVKENVREFKQYEELTIDLISYSHASVVDRILKIIVLYLQGGQQLSLDPKLIIKTIIEKCLASDKAEKEEIKKSCEDVLFWFMDNKLQDHLFNELNEGLVNKNPKIIATSLTLIANLLNNYGIKRMKNLERFSKHLDLLALPPKPMAKQQTIEFYKEVYRWMGDLALKDFKLHMEVKDEIAKFGKEYQKVPIEIKRGIKKQATGNDSKAIYRMDTEQNDNQEEVDVLSAYTTKWVDEVLAIQKWKDKKAVLDEFIKKTRVSNILPREVSHFITLIKRVLSQNNINILLCGFSITQNLSKGLKRHFFNVAKNIAPYLFSKLKDAKPNIVEAAQQALKSLLYSVTLDDLIDEIKTSLEDKAPMMRVQALKFLGNFASKRQQKIMNTLRGLIEKFVRLTEDGAEIVRKQSLELLCNLKKTHGMKFFGDKLKNLDPKKMTVIQLAKVSEGQEMMEIQTQIQANQSVSVAQSTRQQSKMHIQERVQPKQPKQFQKVASKSQVSCPMKPQQPSVQSSVMPKAIKSVSSKALNELNSPNQSIRYNAYQQILTKSSFQDLKQLMYIIKSNVIRESSPNNLKILIQIAKKNSGLDPIDIETLEFIFKHDWKKAKLTLNDFITNNKFTPQASDFIRHNNLTVSNSKVNNSTPQSAIQVMNLRSFMKQLQFLLTKMTNPIPENRIQAAKHAIGYLQALTTIGNETQLTPTNGWNQECINKFCGMVRFRLIQSDDIAGIYAQVIKLMIHKGILTKNKGLKAIMQTVFSKLKERKPFIKQIFDYIAATNAQFLFSAIFPEITRQVNEPLIEFIIENNELFIRNAELRAYICPFLQLVFNSDMSAPLKAQVEKILDQIVELNGENILETQVKKTKIISPRLDQYLAKYNISINMQSYGPKNINVKMDRLKIDEDNPWPIFAAPGHILKLINQLISMKEPLPTLATPLGLTDSILQLIMELDNNFLAEYSDILLKWVYWRTVIDQSEVVSHIIKFAYKVIMAVKDYLSESEFTVLLSSMINVMERFKSEHLQLIGDLLLCIFDIAIVFKERSLLFWINLLIKEQNMKRLPVNEVLKLLTTYYSQALSQHLPTLARSPEVLKNQTFLRYLSSNFDHQHLTASGFRVLSFQRPNKPVNELKPLLSDMGGPENVINITAEEKVMYITLFQKYNSIDLEKQIKEINKTIDSNILIDTHMKIIYSVVVPFMKKQIPVINVFTYFRELARLFNFSEGLKYSHCLKDLTRMLMYFLIDLDDNSIDNKDEITKTVNKIILFILEKSDSRHMLEVLIILIDYQLKLNANTNSKIQHLIYKCIGKVSKFPKFQDKWKQNLLYIVSETNSIFNKHEIKIDHPLIKTVKAIWKNDIISNSTYFNFIENYMKCNAMNPTFTQVFHDVTNNENMASKEDNREKDSRIDINPIKLISTSAVNKLINIKKTEIS